MDNKITHSPVLRKLVQKYLNLKKGDIAVDLTLGLGGHSSDILEKVGPKGHLIAFEQDAQNLKIAKENLKKYKNVTYIHQNFEFLEQEFKKHKLPKVDGILMDLGLCSSHFDLENRGFSFRKDEPLDMRFSSDLTQKTAADLINKLEVQELTDIFRNYGEEKYAFRIASAIAIQRKLKPITTTKELADLIEEVRPHERHSHIHPATQIFQALRIAVNDELEVLKNVLPQTVNILKKNGRLVVISYHSLEDRIVKHFLKLQEKECICPIEILICQCKHEPTLKILTKKPDRPSEDEINENPRSRSALLRAAEHL
ncbi:MAG: 16S rRNA methyltransferase [Candidatus Peregrinibacteria bacterium GW2011_GWF2_38_29]|nr:MAG: 16S rRNA methyltransferase [Candidatus Peregrinibacteria bacterium GW2011_GWF2_38_29]HBB02764.1 16S rRNA (cytosine(1402)-N(4))-methyltransferase [Candidatus Peregrinibacteria bacterium]